MSEAARFFPVRLPLWGLKGASSPFLVGPARRNRWHFSGSLLVAKENIPRRRCILQKASSLPHAKTLCAGYAFLVLFGRQDRAFFPVIAGLPTKNSPGSCRRSFGFYSEHGRAALTFSTVLFYLTNLSTARATMPPRMPDTRNSATPCTPTSSTTNMKGFAAPLTDTRFCT
mgnify:CR=1 FL=1